ncbi:GNAT family N-acetyltransferase [Allonocardiopsis opalescens]|uniref:RimJ/RimL family protein N-acetyltransferase n=1 Tax=Allonocardiopsis opalescens TaxID=1144618 RepID=A0A2T0PXW3_9ACTN|nr:GNAT family protein [Allonocardiopsis opalescens]PRX96349.1 RimJ/RimL family protein N-acetyltransferase [Allonocardiopsis opalescens]
MLTLPLGDGAELRALEPWNAEEFAAFIERERPALAPWLVWGSTIVDAEGARAMLQRYADEQAAGRGRIYGIWRGGTLVGGTLFRVFDTEAGVCELGVWLAAGERGRGLITKASRLMIDWAVHHRGMARVEWRTIPSNAASLAVAERLGMRRDGLLRGGYPFNGERHDVEVWALLAEEWRAAGPAGADSPAH